MTHTKTKQNYQQFKGAFEVAFHVESLICVEQNFHMKIHLFGLGLIQILLAR